MVVVDVAIVDVLGPYRICALRLGVCVGFVGLDLCICVLGFRARGALWLWGWCLCWFVCGRLWFRVGCDLWVLVVAARVWFFDLVL